MFSKIAAVSALTLALQASAGSIIQPSSSWWWQTGDKAALSWDCSDHTYSQFAVVVTNADINLLTAPTDIVPIQNNDQCSVNLVPELKVGTNYLLHLANPLNRTEFWVTSEPFEVKAKGSPYPTSTPSTPNPQNTDSSSDPANPSSSGTPNKDSGASTFQVSLGSLGLVAAVGLTAVLGA